MLNVANYSFITKNHNNKADNNNHRMSSVAIFRQIDINISIAVGNSLPA